MKHTLVASSVFLGLVLVACSQPAPAAPPTVAPTAAASSDAAAGFKRAQDFNAQYLSPATSLGITTPLTSPPPTGKKLYWLQGSLADVATITDGFKAATALLGWDLTTIIYDAAQPEQINSAMQQAVDKNADFIAISGIPVTVFQQALTNATARKIPLFDSYAGESPEGPKNGLYTQVGGPAQFRLFGQITANYAIADSGGTAKEVYVNLPAYPILDFILEGEKAALAANCPTNCHQDTLDISLDDLSTGKVPGLVVSYLQNHPDTKYIRFAIGAMTGGVVQALKAAGLEKNVVILGSNPELANLQAMQDGTERAWVGLPRALSAWYMVDAMARYSLGMSLDPTNSANLPAQILTAKSLTTPLQEYDGPADYPAQFKALWKK